VAKVRKTPAFEKIEELAERVPAPLSWLIPDPYDVGSYLMPVGITKSAAEKAVLPFLKQQFKGRESEEFSRIIRAIPKKLLAAIRDLRLEFSPQLRRALNKETSGSFYPLSREIVLYTGKKAKQPITRTLPHELGHLGHYELAVKMRKPYWDVPTASREAIAEYLAEGIGDKASLVRSFNIPAGGELAEQTLKKLWEMPSKNPWMNVYRYLQTFMEK